MKNNILFIDDDANILDGYKRYFNREKSSSLDKVESMIGATSALDDQDTDSEFRLFFASQGQQGIRVVQERKEAGDDILVAFIDVRMPPGIDGGETARKISEIDPNIELVIVTAYSDTNLKNIVRVVGRPDKLLYLKKPFDPVEMQQLACNLCEKYKLERAKDEFLAHVSHELSTPLSSIIGFVNLLATSKRLSDDDRESALIAYKNAILMKELVEDLISVARMERERPKLRLKRVLVKSLLDDAAGVVQPLMKSKSDIEFVACDFSQDFYITCDELRIKRVLINILSNAYKYTTSGRIVFAASKTDDNYLLVSVRDTGVGISQDKIEMIFEKFFRVGSNSLGEAGLGLGLSIVKTIVEAHKGRIQVESKENVGSVFSVYLPINDPK